MRYTIDVEKDGRRFLVEERPRSGLSVADSRFVEPAIGIVVSLAMVAMFAYFVVLPNLGDRKLDWFATFFMSGITLVPGTFFLWVTISGMRKQVPAVDITRTLLDEDEIDQIASVAPELMPLIEGRVEEYHWPH